MRGVLIPVALLANFTLAGQDWALLNPAYRYNYSNDGTDTIRHQIRVMQVDTLGVDSFRYELNLVGFVCDFSSTGPGEPCNGYVYAVREEQPQFLGYSCIKTNDQWEFYGWDTLRIRNNLEVGASWVFNASDNLTATVDAEWAADVFGMADTLRRIQVSNGDSVVVSRSFGIIHWSQNGELYHSIGVEGAEAGHLFADPLAYFDYQAGDELVYQITSLFWVQPPGGPVYPQSRSHYWMTRITGRSDTDSSRSYATSSARTFPTTPQWGSPGATPAWPMPIGIWLFERGQALIDHPILGSYPGQLLDKTVSWGSGIGYLATSGITTAGRLVMRSRYLELDPGGPSTGVDLYEELAPGLFGFLTVAGAPVVDVWYEEGLGLREARYYQSSAYHKRVSLVGAIIGGDTIIPPPTINWAVGVQEVEVEEVAIIPNPASDFLLLSSSTPGTLCSIADLQGRTVLQHRITTHSERIDLQHLPPGAYVLRIEGVRTQRFVIAR